MKQLLQRSIERRQFADIPSGLKHYMTTHPSDFKNYYNQRRHELGLMKSVLRNLSSHERQLLRDYYIQNKGMQPRNMFDIISRSAHSSSSVPSSSSSSSSAAMADDDLKQRKRSRPVTGRWETASTSTHDSTYSDDDAESTLSMASLGTSLTDIIER